MHKKILGIDWDRKASWKEVVLTCVLIVGLMALLAFLFGKAVPCAVCGLEKLGIHSVLNR